MKVAVVGTGISGMVASWMLAPDHDLVVYEAGDRIGGHTHTVDVELDGVRRAVDTGFIVFNERTYPSFVRILRRLGVGWQPSDMSFSVSCERTGLEYNGTSLDKLFVQRSNLLRPSFWRMVREILRFYREAPALLEDGNDELTLGDYLRRGRYSRAFLEHHLVPMGAAVWSARPARMLDFPARYLVEFFHNHGFLQVDDRPQWLVIRGGSREYVGPLTASFRDRIRLRTPVRRIRRPAGGGVEIETAQGARERFDRVILAVHSDQALRMLADPSDAEREVLSAIEYQENEVLLHTDTSILPKRRRAWASWNYHLPRERADRATVTYWMNLLQSIPGPPHYLVTLNHVAGIDPAKVLRRLVYHHPVYTPAGVRAQRRVAEINGARDTYFCGAWCGWGFHEDGVRSALAVARRFDRELEPEAAPEVASRA